MYESFIKSEVGGICDGGQSSYPYTGNRYRAKMGIFWEIGVNFQEIKSSGVKHPTNLMSVLNHLMMKLRKYEPRISTKVVSTLTSEPRAMFFLIIIEI